MSFYNYIFVGEIKLETEPTMAKFSQLKRMGLVLNKLNGRQGPQYVPADELLRYLQYEKSLSEGGEADEISLRTLQRDFKTIAQLFGITIKHKAGRGYYIAERDADTNAENYEALLINFEMLSSIDQDSTLQKYVLPEHRRPALPLAFGLCLEALRLNRILEFKYTLVRHGNAVKFKRLQPYFLKESQQRWYLIGFEADDNGQRIPPKADYADHPAAGLKTFALDRMAEPEIDRSQRFKRQDGIDRNDLFKDCFGIWNDPTMPIDEILLKYDALDGAFLKTFPLHTSQEIVEETAFDLTIRVRLRITNDFVMELLKRSRSVEVLQPASLRQRLHDVYAEALKRNAPKASPNKNQ